jgi:hypothetical protein
MDPIRTAVKYSLIPLRTAIQIGDRLVRGGQTAEPEEEVQQEPVRARPRPRPQRRPAQKRTTARRTADPQASQAPKDLDDVGLARKVETIIFRDENVPKGKIDVNCAGGVVWLRGEAKTPEMIKLLEQQTAAIPEVTKVENLLHLPKTPAPTRTDTPPAQRRTRSTTRRPEVETVESGQTNERRSAVGEDLPVEAASEGEGRKPAPLGANGDGS